MASSEILTSPSPPSEEPGTVLFETERLIIRRYVLADAPFTSAAGNHPSVTVNMRNRFPSPYTLADAEEFLSVACKPTGTSYPGDSGIFLKSDGGGGGEPVFIGGLGVIPGKDVYYKSWEIGYWLTPSAAGHGYATEAARGLTRWLFATWPGLNRLEASAFGRNLASQNVLKKVGFREEGRKRCAIEKKCEVLDEVFFGLLRTDLE
ncbi:hypothetical protein AK830_g5595 [Neonectria ditissima]|uniref:N-acetyltransferase domain-containing protein n=1 Tax=Neonectria ditissima TaxID=78410 RepID=A0A0N8H768_9HYPO|nr:hypothetical protein AK830_g5595 [Neonectria ditissima]